VNWLWWFLPAWVAIVAVLHWWWRRFVRRTPEEEWQNREEEAAHWEKWLEQRESDVDADHLRPLRQKTELLRRRPL